MTFLDVAPDAGDNASRAFSTDVDGTVAGTVDSGGEIVQLVYTSEPAAPSILVQPRSQTVTAGASVTFTAQATGGNPAATTVQWQVSIDGHTFNNIPAATSTTLTLNNVTAAQNGDEYQAVFSNAAGLSATTTPATLAVDSLTVTTSPGNQTVNAQYVELISNGLGDASLFINNGVGTQSITTSGAYALGAGVYLEAQASGSSAILQTSATGAQTINVINAGQGGTADENCAGDSPMRQHVFN